MPESPQPLSLPIDDALSLAIIQAWDELSVVTMPHAIRVEYLGEAGLAVAQLTVWLVSGGGYQERICDYRLAAASDRPPEWRCWTRLRSPRLTAVVDFIVRNQKRFSRPPSANPSGLVVVFPPTAEQRAEAASWIAGNGLERPAVPRARAAAFG